MGLAESLGAPALLLHPVGIVLLLGRLSHAWGLSMGLDDLPARVAGGVATSAVLLAGAVACLFLAIAGMR